MNRSLALGLALGMFSLTAAHAAESSRPNVIIFLADDLGYGDLGCYGHPRIKSPNLDRFAREGVRLTQCYAASAVCMLPMPMWYAAIARSVRPRRARAIRR